MGHQTSPRFRGIVRQPHGPRTKSHASSIYGYGAPGRVVFRRVSLRFVAVSQLSSLPCHVLKTIPFFRLGGKEFNLAHISKIMLWLLYAQIFFPLFLFRLN